MHGRSGVQRRLDQLRGHLRFGRRLRGHALLLEERQLSAAQVAGLGLRRFRRGRLQGRGLSRLHDEQLRGRLLLQQRLRPVRELRGAASRDVHGEAGAATSDSGGELRPLPVRRRVRELPDGVLDQR
jgi:hypothetical protein